LVVDVINKSMAYYFILLTKAVLWKVCVAVENKKE
jgi:hypothetical protein